MQLPILTVPIVYHVGTMDPADLGLNSPNGTSQEGSSLSVSVCPSAWQQIARFKKGDLHILSKDDASFLDVHSLLEDADLKAEIENWALANGHVVKQSLWRAWSFDDEIDEWRSITLETREDAVNELLYDGDEEEDLEAPDGHEPVEEVLTFVETLSLVAITGMRLGAYDATDSIVMAWAMTEAPGHGFEIDGLWWNETYGPQILSAPRGCIFPDKLAAWSVKTADFTDTDDETDVEAIDNMPEAEWVSSSSPKP